MIIKFFFLQHLKAEDQIIDLTNYKSIKEEENFNNKKQVLKINNLNREIIKLKDKISELNLKNNDLAKFRIQELFMN